MAELLKGEDFLKVSDTLMRDAYADTMLALGARDNRIMVVDVDCSNSMGSGKFRDAYPDQYINAGIQEANAVGVCAGLSVEGQIPFLNAFGVFATRRAFDQIFLSCGYAQLNVKIIGWDAGIGAENNGGTHMPFEDMGIMRSIPDMVVVEPADPVAFASILRQAAAYRGNVYMRCLRKSATAVYAPGSEFELGKAVSLRSGSDVTIIAVGMMVAEALKAADVLQEKGIRAHVLDMHTVKPLDEAAVCRAAEETGAIVTAENHRMTNGLFSAVTDCTAKNLPCPVEGVGVDEIYGEVGKMPYLQNRFGLTCDQIVQQALRAIERKEKM